MQVEIPDEMHQAIEEIIADHPEYGYADANEFIREAIRTSLLTLDM